MRFSNTLRCRSTTPASVTMAERMLAVTRARDRNRVMRAAPPRRPRAVELGWHCPRHRPARHRQRRPDVQRPDRCQPDGGVPRWHRGAGSPASDRSSGHCHAKSPGGANRTRRSHGASDRGGGQRGREGLQLRRRKVLASRQAWHIKRPEFRKPLLDLQELRGLDVPRIVNAVLLERLTRAPRGVVRSPGGCGSCSSATPTPCPWLRRARRFCGRRASWTAIVRSRRPPFPPRRLRAGAPQVVTG